ncbi:hypothetical protein D3C87_1025960 [compost metagenome]
MQSTLMIKDLPLDKELDGKKMSAVRGGNGVYSNSVASNVGFLANFGNTNTASANPGYGGVAVASVAAPVTQTLTQVAISMPAISVL